MANVNLGVRSTSMLASTAASGQSAQRGAVPVDQARSGGQAAIAKLPEVADEGIKALLEKSASSAQLVSRDLKINVDDASGKYVISVLDSKTDEVIRQFPPEGALNMLETISRIVDEGKGSLISEKG